MDKFAVFVNNPFDFVTTMISYGEMHESMSSSQKGLRNLFEEIYCYDAIETRAANFKFS